MLTQERYDLILKAVNEKITVNVAELTHLTGASESTIRRDLIALDEMKLLTKIHGGATALRENYAIVEEDVFTKIQKNKEEKDRIAQYAASLVNDNDFVMIDAGTTTDRLIEYLDRTSKATFVTNGITHGEKLVRKGLKTYVLGGMIRPVTEAIVGTEALENLRRYNFTKCFVGVNGITVENGYTTPNIEEAAVKREILKHSYMKVILADYTKFGITASINFGDIGEACIITDRRPEEKYMDATVIKEAK
ncbi:MAG TPA: DeoR/GlpR transcriptional regulator [Candidatus Avimonoglobus intestinipullorum]|uniref:DeoR/GlpR transcriptional regulator n=1 Tax=Candidatus Avimonoglobus intestinipullorum TaxID=2840699 RepID=A0A9D1LUH8_9FIRM|nr:DeoR/GlpR transcriptional regulator [Candidatus Avimonoglobus intestinipullorum]